MRVFSGHDEARQKRAPTSVAIGIFDGVHLGHQALLRTALAHGGASGLRTLAYTFHPHPARVLNAPLAPLLLESLDARLGRMQAMGLDAVLVEPFSRLFAATSAEAFVQEILVDILGARHIVVGAGFTFGSRQRGNVALLQQMAPHAGFAVHPVAHVRVDGIEVSSTKIREFVHAGQMAGATMLLGRPFALQGLVVSGARRGATLGFPTANLRPENEILPASGVYAGTAAGPFGKRQAVVNIGVAPTFGGTGAAKVEAHLLEYDGASLYGLPLSVALHERLREEQRFDGVEALKAQIGRDVERAREVLARSLPEP